VTTAAAMLAASTLARRIKLERFGKSSVVLARCSSTNGPAPDQSAYEPFFSSASSILTAYRELLDARKLIPAELARIGGSVTRRKDESSAHHP